MDSLNTETKTTGTRMQNVFNEFLMLSNSQFIENRVYEEVSCAPPTHTHTSQVPPTHRGRAMLLCEHDKLSQACCLNISCVSLYLCILPGAGCDR